jgi:CHAT domain-containing protein
VLRRETGRRTVAAKAVAVLADPVFDGKDERVAMAAASRRTREVSPVNDARPINYETTPAGESKIPAELRRASRAAGVLRDGQQSLSRLPFSRREAEMILAAARAGAGLKVLDFEANQASATSARLSEYRIVHFATHGILNSEQPELSGIVLSLVDERGLPVDGFLGLNEIYNLHLPAELVVLSACQTALGKEIKGEGLIGLVRGFMYAGAPRVVASLWKVDDRATAELMKHFYDGMLKKNLRPAAALRRAKVEMLKTERFRAPFYWAAFELQGEWR